MRRRTRVRDPDDRDGASGLCRRQTLARTKVGRERGDDLVDACRPTAGDEAVRGELRAAPAVRLHIVRTEAAGNRIVGDRRAHSRHPSQPADECAVDTHGLAEDHVVVGADVLVAGDDRGRRCVARDRRVALERRLEQHPACHDEDGRAEECEERADVGAEALPCSDDREAQHVSLLGGRGAQQPRPRWGDRGSRRSGRRRGG